MTIPKTMVTTVHLHMKATSLHSRTSALILLSVFRLRMHTRAYSYVSDRFMCCDVPFLTRYSNTSTQGPNWWSPRQSLYTDFTVYCFATAVLVSDWKTCTCSLKDLGLSMPR